MLSVGVVVVPGLAPISLSAFSALQAVNAICGTPRYAYRMVSEHGGLVPTSSGFSVDTVPLGDDTFDTLVMAAFGNAGHGDHTAPASLLPRMDRMTRDARRVASFCTGAFVLAEAGLLEGRRATIHWRHVAEFSRRFPGVRLVTDRLYVTDGKFWTAAGQITALDLTLALIEDDFGPALAREVARRLVMERRRPGALPQQSTLLDVEPKSDRIETVLAYVRRNLKSPLTVAELADVAHLSPRQFSRAFTSATGQPPAKVIERMRVEAAQAMIVASRHSLDTVAAEVGFADRERMRRAFLRCRGKPPQELRRMSRELAAV